MYQNIGTYCVLKNILSTQYCLLSTQIQRYAVLCDTQHGFHPNRCCVTQLIITINDFAECLNKGCQCNVLVLDFSQVLDKSAACLSKPETISLWSTWVHTVMASGSSN